MFVVILKASIEKGVQGGTSFLLSSHPSPHLNRPLPCSSLSIHCSGHKSFCHPSLLSFRLSSLSPYFLDGTSTSHLSVCIFPHSLFNPSVHPSVCLMYNSRSVCPCTHPSIHSGAPAVQRAAKLSPISNPYMGNKRKPMS